MNGRISATSVSQSCRQTMSRATGTERTAPPLCRPRLSKSQEATVNAEKFMMYVRRHLAFEELTPTLLREIVEKIVVHECSYDENKTRRQDIEIYYSFVGKVDLPE